MAPEESHACLAAAETEAVCQPFATDPQAVASHSWLKVRPAIQNHNFHAVLCGHYQAQIPASAAYALSCLHWHEGR